MFRIFQNEFLATVGTGANAVVDCPGPTEGFVTRILVGGAGATGGAATLFNSPLAAYASLGLSVPGGDALGRPFAEKAYPAGRPGFAAFQCGFQLAQAIPVAQFAFDLPFKNKRILGENIYEGGFYLALARPTAGDRTATYDIAYTIVQKV